MAYDRGFLKVSWLFAIKNSDEIAVTSLNFTNVAPGTFNPAEALDEIDISLVGLQLYSRMAVLLVGTSIKWADYSELRAVRIAAVLEAGPEVDPAKQYDESTVTEGNDADVLPQSSIVLSMRSGSSAGSGNFGRMYLPHTAFSLMTDIPRAAPGSVASFVSSCGTFVNGCNTDLNGAVTQPLRAAIMTQVVGGFAKNITQIAVGDVVDTQRRRRNQLPENYTFGTIP